MVELAGFCKKFKEKNEKTARRNPETKAIDKMRTNYIRVYLKLLLQEFQRQDEYSESNNAFTPYKS